MRYKLFSLLGVAAIISIIGLLAPVLLISRGKLFWMSSKQQDNGMSGDGPKEPTLTASAVSNVVAGRSASNFTHVFMDTNVINQSFSLVTDPQSGQYATVSADVGSVVLRDKSGKVGWSNNIAALANQLPLTDVRII